MRFTKCEAFASFSCFDLFFHQCPFPSGNDLFSFFQIEFKIRLFKFSPVTKDLQFIISRINLDQHFIHIDQPSGNQFRVLSDYTAFYLGLQCYAPCRDNSTECFYKNILFARKYFNCLYQRHRAFWDGLLCLRTCAV